MAAHTDCDAAISDTPSIINIAICSFGDILKSPHTKAVAADGASHTATSFSLAASTNIATNITVSQIIGRADTNDIF